MLCADAVLLGSPLWPGSAVDHALKVKIDDLQRAIGRLKLLPSHEALVLLKNAMCIPRIMHILRSTPCGDSDILSEFDVILRSGLSAVLNIDLSDSQWRQASLPVKDGGIGIRGAVLLAPSAYLASAAGTSELTTLILSKCKISNVFLDQALSVWSVKHAGQTPALMSVQRNWDKIAVEECKQSLLENLTDKCHIARLLAAQAPHSGDWLNAVPIVSCGLLLSDEAVRVAVGYRLGANICRPHACPCGKLVDDLGHHALCCSYSAGRHSRHNSINEIIWRSLSKAQIPSIREPAGLFPDDAKRPDGVSQVPWAKGRCVAWDATVPDTLAECHLPNTFRCAGAAADLAAVNKTLKYAELGREYVFVPVAVETLGPINSEGADFISDLGQRITAISGDLRETAFLFQRISIAIQRGNALSFLGSFTSLHEPHD